MKGKTNILNINWVKTVTFTNAFGIQSTKDKNGTKKTVLCSKHWSSWFLDFGSQTMYL